MSSFDIYLIELSDCFVGNQRQMESRLFKSKKDRAKNKQFVKFVL